MTKELEIEPIFTKGQKKVIKKYLKKGAKGIWGKTKAGVERYQEWLKKKESIYE